MQTLQLWWRALRPFSFPASLGPSLTGICAAVAFHHAEETFTFSFFNAVLTVMGCIAIHATSNLLNDYFDWRSGLDTLENSGAVNPLVRKDMSPSEFLRLSAAVAACAIAIGAYFIVTVGMPVVWLVAVGAISAWAYTAPPLKLKWRALGEFQVMLSFGVLMTIGSYIVQAAMHATLQAQVSVLLLSLPQSMLIAAILHANNHRDRIGDRQAGAQTLSLMLGTSVRSVAAGRLLIASAYLLHGVIVLATLHEPYPIFPETLIAWVSFPLAWRAAMLLPGSDNSRQPQYAKVVPAHAQLQLVYSLLMIVGLVLAAGIR